MADTIRAVRATPAPPRILVAASKPKMFALAAEQADTVALGLPPQATEDELTATVTALRTAAGGRRDELEVQLNLVAVAERAADIPEWVSRMTGGGDARQMAAAGGIAFLLGSSGDIADQLRRRREAYGISYIAVNALFAEQLAPVVAMLRGR